jgi:regulatory protein
VTVWRRRSRSEPSPNRPRRYLPGTSEASGLDRALELAYRYLDRRERTVGEVRRRLQAKGIDPSLADEAIAALTEQGVLDDARFARLFAQDKRELERWGAERIRRGLLSRGVDPELITEALGDLTAASELDRALDLLHGRFPSPPRERRARDRALGALIRKGYDPEVALDALAAYGRDCA